jgi:tetratricopeptide (TPR) repeat protein
MRISKILIAVAIFLGLMFTGFDCGSTEITSARLYIQQKNYDKALEVLKADVAKNPKSDEGYYLLGYAYGQQDDIQNMVESYDKSLTISNKFQNDIEQDKSYHWANTYNAGVNLFQRGNKAEDKDSSKIFYDKSIEAFNSAIMIRPDSSDNYRNLAFVYLSTQQNDKAIQPLQKLIDLENSADGYQYLGEIYYTKGVNTMSKYKTGKNSADSLEAIDDFNKSIDILEKGQKLYPENTDMLVTLSNAYIGANKIEVAMDAFKTGVEKEPDNQYYRYNYGVLLLGAKNYSEAEAEFKKAIDIDPTYTNAIYNLGVTYVKWGADLNKKADEEGTMGDAYKTKYEAALPYLEKVVEMEPDNADMWDLLAKVYTVLGMTNEATDAYNKVDNLRK